MRRLLRRRRSLARPRAPQEQIVATFKVPVCRVPLSVEHLDGTTRPWSYKAVLN